MCVYMLLLIYMMTMLDFTAGRLVKITNFDTLFGPGSNDTMNRSDRNQVPLAGGFSVNDTLNDGRAGCPENYVSLNDRCWIAGTKYYLEVKNKFMEYHDASDSMRAINAHYITITAWTGENSVSGNVPVSDIPLTVSMRPNTGQPRPKALTLLFPNGKKQRLSFKDSFTVITNMYGRAVFSIEEDGNLALPIMMITAPFSNATVSFQPNLHALHQLSSISSNDLRNLTNDESMDENALKSAAYAIRQLVAPMMNLKVEHADSADNQVTLHKRGRFDSEDAEFDRIPYSVSSSTIQTLVENNGPSARLNPSFDDIGSFGIVTPEIYQHIIDISSTSGVNMYRRTYFSDKLNELKVAINSTEDYFKATFVDVPKAVLSKFENKTEYMDNLKSASSNAVKEAITASRDVIKLLPFGNIVVENLGMNDLVKNISESDVIIVTPFDAGVELFVMGPKQAFKTLIQSFRQIGGIIVAILKRVGITLAAVFNQIKASFNWGDILRNHRILSAHFMKMVPFMKAEITNRNGDFSNDIADKVNILGNFTNEATQLFVNGSIQSLPNLISNANRDIYRNLTNNPALQVADGPDDIKTTFLTDHLASNVDSMHVDVTDEDQKSILDVPVETLKNLGSLGDESLQSFKMAYDKLKQELSKDDWNFGTIYNLIRDLMRFAVTVAIDKTVRALLIVFDFVVTLFDRVLRSSIKIPYISSLYENVITNHQSRLSLYDLFALVAAVPLTVAFKAIHQGRNLFTQDEADVLLATENPEYYVDNLVSLGLQVPGRSANQLRTMYRMTVSYILGTGYAAGQQISAIFGSKVTTPFGLYFLRAPFEFVSILCNFPWSWYTLTQTQVGVNIRFLSWIFQFSPLFIGWPAETAYAGFNVLPLLGSLLVAIPNIYIVLQVWAQDLKLVGGADSVYSPGSTSLDITMKAIGRLIRYTGMIMITAHPFPGAVGRLFRQTVFVSALFQTLRLYIDIPDGSIYSV